MSRRVLAICTLLLAVALVEFAVLAGALTHVDISGAAQPAHAGVAFTNTPTPTSTVTATGTPSLTATPTPTSTPFSPPPPTPNTGSGSISGVITNGQTTPIVGANVHVVPRDCCGGPEVDVTTTAGGAYTAPGLGTGKWRVSADAPGRPTRYYNNTYNYYLQSLVNVTDGANTPSINLALLQPGHVTGTVTNALGTPIAGAYVYAGTVICCATGGSASSTLDGSYDIEVPPGAYKVSASASGFAQEYYNDSYPGDGATGVTVTESATTSGIDFALAKGAMIKGYVTDGSATPIVNASVYATRDGLCCVSGYGYTLADGSYVIVDLAPGSYQLYISAPGFVSEYYNNTYDYGAATLIPLAVGGSASDINITLSTGGSISGIVRDASASPIAGAQVYASQDGCCGSGSATSGADGTYQITALAPGNYRVSATASGHAGEFYNGTQIYSSATLVAVNVDATTPNIDFSLDEEAVIKGFVRDEANQPIAGAYVYAVADNCCVPGVYTATDGSYEIDGLPGGGARVYAQANGFVAEYYNNADSYDDATAIPLAPGVTQNDINFQLTAEATISGVVLDDATQPMPNTWVYADRDPCCGGGGGQTDANGVYVIDGLAAGTYRVSASPNGYIGKYYDNVTDYSDATLVTLTSGQHRTGVDFSLTQGAHITGTVTGANAQPLANADVSAFSTTDCCGSGRYGYATTDAQGHYDISGLLPGSFSVHADRNGYIGEYYDDVPDGGGQPTEVITTDGNTTSGIDFSLEEASHITGVVLDASNQPIEGVQVSARTEPCCHDGYAYTDANGAYDIDTLIAGTYVVMAERPGFATEYYDNVFQSTLASNVVLPAHATVPDIDFNLDHGGAVTGVVRNEGSVPLENAYVEFRLQPGMEVVRSGATASDGSYSVTDLPPGDYKIDAYRWTDYMTEYYNNAEDPATATLVHVTKDVTTPGIDFSLRVPNQDKWKETLDFFEVEYTGNVSTTGFGVEAGETQPCGNIGATAWFKHWVQSYPTLLPLGAPPAQVSFPVEPVTMQADTGGSNFDTVLAVYDDADPSPPSGPLGIAKLLECNDDAAGGSTSALGAPLAAGDSKVTWNAIPGHAYIIQAGGKNGATGNLVLNVGCPGDGDCDAAANAGDNCPSVWNYDQQNTDNAELITPGVAPHDTSRPNGDALGDACDPDIDNDGLPNESEGGVGVVSPPGTCATSTALTDPYEADTDGDLVIDGAECALGSDPNNAASKPVVGGTDNDNDGLSNAFEAVIGSNPNLADTDSDGVLDGVEYKGYGTSLTSTNSDGDTCSDGREVASVDALNAVNALDLQLIAQSFGRHDRPVLDVNKDGNINSLDLQFVAQNFAPGGC